MSSNIPGIGRCDNPIVASFFRLQQQRSMPEGRSAGFSDDCAFHHDHAYTR
jgi:hypothetical protein